MQILILHRIPYHKIQYHRGIDHGVHEVVYAGTKKALATIPGDLRCTRVERPGERPAAEEVLALFSGSHDFDRVISLSEYELMDAATVREAWGVPGPTVAQTRLVRDKVLMKSAVAAAGIDVPQHVRWAQRPASLPWTGKTVLKPVDGASSENVRIFATAAQALDALRARPAELGELDPDRYELEEFVAGDIVHFDGAMVGGEPVAVLGSKYIRTCAGFAAGEPLGSVQFDAPSDLMDVVMSCLRAVEIRDSSFHLELILSERGPVFLEIAARVGGADVVDCFELATGVYLPAVELAAMIGDVRELPQPRRGNKYGWFVFPGHHLPSGQCTISGLERFCGHPNLVRLSQLAPDQPLPRGITYQAVEVPVAGVVQAETTEVAKDLIQAIFSTVSVHPRAGGEAKGPC